MGFARRFGLCRHGSVKSFFVKVKGRLRLHTVCCVRGTQMPIQKYLFKLLLLRLGCNDYL